LDSSTLLPHPSHLYWMPLTSIIAALSMLLFGQTFAAARVPFVVIASLLPPIAYRIARTVGSGWIADVADAERHPLHAKRLQNPLPPLPRHALTAGLLTVFSGFYPAFWGTTDAFALYACIGALTLFAIARGAETGRLRWWALAGVGAGLAHLTRADGILLLAVALFFAFTSRPHPHTPILLFGYLLVTLPWFIRNIQVAGSPFGAGGAGTLWLIEYNDLFNYPSNLSAARYFAAGPAVILRGKWEALITNMQTILAVQGLIFLAPFIAIGLWRLRKHSLYRPVILYAALLYAAMTFAFSFPGARGGLFHSGAALAPFYFPAALVGLDAAIEWIAARRAHWQAEKAKRNFSVITVVLACLLSLGLLWTRLPKWNEGSVAFALIGAAIPGDAVVMSNNPPGLWIATGHPGVPLPNGDASTVMAVADQFHVRYLLLDKNYPAGMADIYNSNGLQWLRLVNTWGEWKLFEVMR
ncbi:MAG: glycosyltransferase family 39 protein, partial [Chloroflexota bacterium]